MRRRPILLAAAAVAVAGLAAFGTVVAQQPTGSYPAMPKGPAGPPPATPIVRPYSDWTATPPPAGYTPTQPGARPVGTSYVPPPPGSNTQVSYPPPGGTPANRPRLAAPGVSTGDIKPAGAFDIPPPSMDLGVIPKPPATTGAPLLPPSVSVDVPNSKFPPSPPVVAPPRGTPPPVELGPVPAPVLPAPPVTVTLPPVTVPAPPSGVVPPAPKPFPVTPTAPTVVPAAPTQTIGNASLPTKINQSVTVEAVCPESVVFNATFQYELVVRNEGNVAVQNVRVEDEVPAGARYVGSDPPAELNGDKLVWAVGTMDARADKRITVRLRPSEEGELRSRATVSYSASVEARTRVTRPRISVSATCAESCRVGEDAVFQIKVTNSGTGPAEKMVLRAEMSEGLFYPQAPKLGPKLETTLASLPAGETKVLTLPLNAVKSGLNACQFTVTAEGSQDTSAKAAVNVVEAMLQITQTGPAKCLVRGEPTYEITLTNPGTAATDPVTLHAVLPDGFDYIQASDAGAYSTTNRAISWKLQALAPNGTKTVALKLRATAAGDVALRTIAVAVPDQPIAQAGTNPKPAGRVLEAKGETAIRSEGVAAVRFEVKDLEDPVEVGKEAVYEIRVTNQGTGACTNVQLMAALSDGTTFSSASGPTNVKAQGQTLVFDPIQTLPVKGETVYTVRVKGNVAGDQRFRVQLTCDQVRTPVVKEESTSFYKQ